MTYLIDKLTPEQVARLPHIRDEWIAHGLSTEPADRDAAIEGVNAAYRAAGLEPPRIVVWLDSPLAGVYGSWLLTELAKQMARENQVWGQVGGQVWGQVGGQVWGQVGGQVWDQVRGQVRDQVRDQVGGQVWDQVGGQVWDQVRGQVGGQVRGQVWGQVWGQVGDQVWGQVWGQVWDQVGDQVWGQVWGQVRDQVRGQYYNAVWGQHDAGWMSWFDTFREFGLKCTEKAAGLIQVAKSAGWWFPLRGMVVITERPAELHLDNQGRLHGETGPALRYRDGFSVHAWHGTRVPANFYTHPWTIEDIFQEKNAEVRRCAIERYGWDNLAEHLTLVATAPDPGNDPHHLALYDLPEQLEDIYEERARILLCVNGSVERDGTRRRFGLPVPAHHTDPVAAAADLYGWPVAEYRQLEVRR